VLSVEDAWRRLETLLEPLPAILLPRRAALGARTAAPIAARADLPGADVSALDGFAFAGELAAGVRLPVAFTVAAGGAPGARLPAGAAARVMTGAPVPAGADRVVAIEATRTGPGWMELAGAAPPAGAALRRRGEVIAAGAELLPAGARLGPAALSLLASQGIDALAVHRPPRVALLPTGDEVVPPDADPPPGSLRDSHTDYLLAAGARLGLEFTSLGIAPDDPELLAERVEVGLAYDLLLTCGGVSAGDFDHLEGVLARLGCETLFDAVAMQPGKPMVAARRGRALVLGLPGNPTSAMVGFALFAAPALDRLRGGDARTWSGAFEVEAAAALPGARDRDRFLPARRLPGGGAPRALPLATAGSHDLAAFARADLLVRVRAGEAPRAAGARLEAIEVS